MTPLRLTRAAALSAGWLAVMSGPLASSLAAQDSKPLQLEDYGPWSRITSVAISPDGSWMTYAYAPNEGDTRFFIRNLDDMELPPADSAVSGTGPVFSEDGRWLAYITTPPEEEADRLREEREPVPRTLHLRNLASGETTELDNVASFQFSENSRWLATGKTRPGGGGGGTAGSGRPGGPGGGGTAGGGSDDEASRGADLILRELASGVVTNIGNVGEFAFNEEGTHLAYVVDAEDRIGNGLYLKQLESGRVFPLSTGQAIYARLTWNEQGDRMAALRGSKPDSLGRRENVLLAFVGVKDVGTSSSLEPLEYDPSSDSSFPEGFVASELQALTWSEDGNRIFFGIKEQEEVVEESDEPEADVDVWHWKDERIQSVQMVQAAGDRRSTDQAVLNLDGMRFVRLADDDMRQVQISDDGRWGIGYDDSAYRMDRDNPSNRRDAYLVDPTSGERTLIAEALVNPMGISPDSRWFLFWQDRKVQAFHLESSRIVDLTARTGGVDFEDTDFDRPVQKPTYGVGGWSNDGRWVFLNGKYDVWKVSLEDDQSLNLTSGAGERDEVRYRIVDLDLEDDGLDTTVPLFLSAYGDWTKKSGYFRARDGQDPEPLLWEDAMIGSGGFRSPGVVKARDASRVLFTRQTFVDFPDWWVTDPDFHRPSRVTEANPQQAEYAWGSRVLLDYTDGRGNRLQATLTLPAGYEEGRRYPMIMYFYEKMSQRHHEFSMPVYDDRPHMSTYASNGYLVLMPDIIYDTGYPGSSALDDVTAAARAAIDAGYADADRICLQGHSWGGYETSFIVTQTDMFACVVTGAPLTNLISMYNINYKSSGSSNGPILEWSQGRMDTSPYHDFDLYVSQSPLHHVERISTPFLILHGTEDGAVDWNQGLEYYNAARRMGKEVILLSYPGEPHHLSREENQKDFQIRMKQYFDHYLKDEPAPRWLAEGVPFLQKENVGPKDPVKGGR
jgi:dipeptidyl aminopeptidase/acylaminoacyl peptidase